MLKIRFSFINIVILINFIVFVLTFLMPELKVVLSLNPYSFVMYYNGFFTYAFAHSDFMHFAFNMVALYGFGNRLESFVGSVKIAIVYILSVVFVGIVCAFVMYVKIFVLNLDFYLMLGASGSVCALLGYFCSIDRAYFKEYLVAILVMSFVPMFIGINIAYDAHIVGFFFGYFLSFIKFFKIKNTIL